MPIMAYSETTKEIRISVHPSAVLEDSSPVEGKYAFSYTVTIENLGAPTVRLLERHWIVIADGEPFAEVVGPGVVGELPELGKGESYTYSSGTVINSPVGSMYGSYTFRADSGEYFEATIPTFDLVFPTVLN